MKAIILAAGSGSRMEPLTREFPKALLKLAGETLLTRLRRQLNSSGVTEVIVVAGYFSDKVIEEVENTPIDGLTTTVILNENYENDTNIGSLNRALNIIDGGYYIFEADIIFENDCISFIMSPEWKDSSVWYTIGAFKNGQYGGVLKTDSSGNVIDINIVGNYEPIHKGYKKLIGVTKVGDKEANKYKEFVKSYVKEKRDCYYLTAWYENQDILPSLDGDISKFAAISFNREDEFYNAVDFFMNNITEFSEEINNDLITLVKPSVLRQIEGFSEERVEWLKKKIIDEGIWSEPIKLERNHMLVLDGQHRMQAALQLGLRLVPCINYDYDDVDVWSLRKEELVSREHVIKRVLKGDLYPYKTVKHKFKKSVKCHYKLSDLGY